MAAPKMLLPTLAWDERFRVENAEDVMTPALLLYPDALAANINAIVKSLSGDASRWRAHVKTAKLAFTMRMLVARGVTNFKCATTLELLVACESGATDVLMLADRVVTAAIAPVLAAGWLASGGGASI